MRDVFDLEPKTQILRSNSYILSYPHILAYFKERDMIEAGDLVRGAHIAYGWMPTVLELYPGAPNLDLSGGAELLIRARRDGTLANDEIDALARLINNSLVGASKLLHFVAPDHFAIWDSRIYAFLFERKSSYLSIRQVEHYRRYLETLAEIRSNPRFREFHRSVNNKVGYSVSALRAIELVMFLNTRT